MRFVGLVFVAVAGFGLMAGPVFAQTNNRSWLSGAGTSADCTRTAPCPSLATALAATVAGGEVNVLDGGGFGSGTVTRSVSIVGSGAIGGILSVGAYGLTVNLPNDTDKVMIENFELDGQGYNVDGIRVTGKGRVYVRRCTIRNFGGNAINVVGAANVRVYVVDSDLVGNGGGINVQGAAGTRVSVELSKIVSNGFGVRVNGASNVANVAFIQRSFIDSNTSAGVQVQNASTVVISDSTLSGSGGPDLAPSGGGQAISYGNNLIRSGNPTQTLTTK